MYIPFVPVLVAAHLLVAVPASIPKVDIPKTCEAAAGEMTELMVGSTARHDLDVCRNSEQAARAQLAKNWATFSAAEKAQCVQPSVYLPSYIEWLTCLEMEMSVRRPNAAP
jgi:hypothetical protein